VTGALVLFVVAALGMRGAFGDLIPQLFWVLLIPGSVLGIAVAYVYFLRGLDELIRRIHLEAFSLAYASTMVLFFAAVAFGYRDLGHLGRMPGWTYLVVLLAEPLRGVFLAYLAKKYA
jgi:hypothetical protein